VNPLACEELAGGLDAFGRHDMTQVRIEFLLDLETSSSRPFRRNPSLLCGNDGIILTVHQKYLGEPQELESAREGAFIAAPTLGSIPASQAFICSPRYLE